MWPTLSNAGKGERVLIFFSLDGEMFELIYLIKRQIRFAVRFTRVVLPG